MLFNYYVYIELNTLLNHVLYLITISHLDYVGFIKKIMKLLQKGYDEIQSLEVELRILEETAEPPSRPRKYKTQHKQG